MGRIVRQSVICVTLAVGLSGCMGSDFEMPFAKGKGQAEVTRGGTSTAFEQAQADRATEHRSDTIDALIARRSAIPNNSPYAKVADAALAASSRTAEAELQQARLRSRAADKNWLPSLGPHVSLTSLSSFVATLVIDQVIFDNGRKKAEREFARADVEAAAVQLSQDQNDRVHTALSLYLIAEENREKAAAAAGALDRMREMERIMGKRVEGGISDMSELSVIRSKVAELEATRTDALNEAKTAQAELAAMTARPVDNVHGTTQLNLPGKQVQPLSIYLAQAEMERSMAQAAISRAGFLPGISAGAAISNRGISGPDISLSSDSGFGFGTPDNLRAVDASKDAAGRRVSQAQEDVNRRLAALGEKRLGQSRRSAQAVSLSEQGRANANLFKRQFEAGTRTVSEVASVIETMARLDAEAIGAKYAAARTEIEIGRELGVLADGSDI